MSYESISREQRGAARMFPREGAPEQSLEGKVRVGQVKEGGVRVERLGDTQSRETGGRNIVCAGVLGTTRRIILIEYKMQRIKQGYKGAES